jgi:hypothetical protein
VQTFVHTVYNTPSNSRSNQRIHSDADVTLQFSIWRPAPNLHDRTHWQPRILFLHVIRVHYQLSSRHRDQPDLAVATERLYDSTDLKTCDRKLYRQEVCPSIRPRISPLILLNAFRWQWGMHYITVNAEPMHASKAAFPKLWSADHRWSSGSALVVLLD